MDVILVLAMLVNTPTQVHASELTDGAALFQEHCSVCHGVISSEAHLRFRESPPQHPAHLVLTRPSERGLIEVSRQMTQRMISLEVAGIFVGHPEMTDDRVVVVPPYGPPLRGVIGRVAGSVEGFAYSQAFKRILQGVTWNHDALDRWITDSQAWVPGSMMFYTQPDPEIRRKIIIYLEAQR